VKGLDRLGGGKRVSGRWLASGAAATIFFAAFLAFAPPAAACDEDTATCFGDGFPEGYAHHCEAHLIAAEVQAWVTCATGISIFAVGSPVEPAAPTVSPGGFVRVDVLITRTSNANGSTPWNFRVQEGVPGVTLSGSVEMAGVLSGAKTSASFNFSITANASTDQNFAVVGVALWNAKHVSDVGYLGINISQPSVRTFSPFEWIAIAALVVAVVALLVAWAAWRRIAPP
jgi:hypothetical protein